MKMLYDKRPRLYLGEEYKVLCKVAQFAGLNGLSMSTLLRSLKYSIPRTRLSAFSTNASACNSFHDHESIVAFTMALPNNLKFGQVGLCPANNSAQILMFALLIPIVFPQI